MMITREVIEYATRCFSAGALLPEIHECEECGVEFQTTFAAEESHGVIRLPNKGFTIIVGCEGYHQIRFDYGFPV